MMLSYLVTCHNETTSLDVLLTKLVHYKNVDHEIVVLDDHSDDPLTASILSKYKSDIKLHTHRLENDYGKHKNVGIELCQGEWIFQIDGDECPTDDLLDNIDVVLQSNNQNEVIWVPRLNVFEGITDNDIKTWGWNYTDGLVNFPDYQSRLFRNKPHIRYQRRLHEKVEGFKSYAFIPPQKTYAIWHRKSIEKQRQNNLNYNKNFTPEENKGYSV